MNDYPIFLLGILLIFSLADDQVNSLRSVNVTNRDDKATHIYVVRRALDGGPPRAGVVAHSGVVVKTEKGNHYLIEYMKDEKVHVNKVTFSVDKEDSDHRQITMSGYSLDDKKLKSFKWTIQKTGAKLDGSRTVDELKKLMKSQMNGYNLRNENCHTAQERLRKKLGVLN